MPGLGTILPLQLYLSNTPTGSRHLPPSMRNQESHSIKRPWPETRTTQRQGIHVYRCRGERQIGWPRLWDFALDHGPRCIDGLRNLVRVITFPPHALSACPLCEEENVPRDSLLSHVLNSHTRSLYSSNDI